MITVSAETYEALEEENEALKLMLARAKSARNARLKSETTSPTPATPPINSISNTNSTTNSNPTTATVSHPTDACSCCKRNYQGLVVLPCKHTFCGVVFCEASMLPHCFTCGTYITGKVPREPEETSYGEVVQ